MMYKKIVKYVPVRRYTKSRGKYRKSRGKYKRW